MVSILVSAKDGLETLTAPCIRSLIQTTGVPYELIGIDDGSRDGTYQFFLENCHKAIRLSGVGCGASRNVGLLHAAGDHIMFLDNDIILDRPGWLGVLLAECGKRNVGIIGPVLTNEREKASLPRSRDGLIDVDETALPALHIRQAWDAGPQIFHARGRYRLLLSRQISGLSRLYLPARSSLP